MNSMVGDLLNRKGRFVHSIDPGATVFDAISKMVDLSIGSLLVVDNTQALAGIITSTDYLKKVALQGRSSRTSFVIEIMNPDLVFINERFSIPRCLYLMTEHRVHYLPVLEDGELSGIISIGDCAREIAYDHDVTVQYFTDLIERRYPV
ncbi:CBS domain-containing protein [Bradymonas sediminis]|uniref:Histidine kinase n=1 Tax=Bradymonas sediminis TaxID=1548548 RepID=A0A2Z4FI00_9DELT|nr:CBS domain-containing protein [Bradymonas sediminis]AWV88513.1 histidine kinase [Bradymonas sediminis]TDP77650.1 CBS domain protein [Bradymonas sediminis]